MRSARARLQSCDIVYAPVGDIPWREGAFDTVLMQWKGDADSLDRMLGEVLRVLKPGGQLVLGAACWPAAMNALRRWMSAGTESTPVNRCTLQTRLTDLSFEQVSWQRTGPGHGRDDGLEAKAGPGRRASRWWHDSVGEKDNARLRLCLEPGAVCRKRALQPGFFDNLNPRRDSYRRGFLSMDKGDKVIPPERRSGSGASAAAHGGIQAQRGSQDVVLVIEITVAHLARGVEAGITVPS